MVLAAAVAASGPAALRSPAKLHGNNFFSNCRFSHASHDDPIVHPGHAGASHAHTFFGNDSTNASSTVASLRRASTTCKPDADTSHMAYSRDYVCPRSHPVKVPLIRLTVRYPIDRGSGLTLASGGVYSGHADFFNAWDQRALSKLVDDCFHDRPCNERRR